MPLFKKSVLTVGFYVLLVLIVLFFWKVNAEGQKYIDGLRLDKGKLSQVADNPDRWLSTWLTRNGECSNFAALRDGTDTEDNQKRLFVRIVHNFWRTLDKNRHEYTNPRDIRAIQQLYDKFPLKAYSCMQSGDPDILYYIPEDYNRLIM